MEEYIKVYEELEKKPLSKLSSREIRALMACKVGKNIGERALCYRGFQEGVKYMEESRNNLEV